MEPQKIRNRDIYTLKSCKGILDEIRMLREKDESERRAMLGSPKYDGMPKGSGTGGLEDVIFRAEKIHKARMRSIRAYERQIAACEAVLQKIPDTTHRALIRALYVEQMPIWRAAQVTHMSEATAKRIKAEYERMEHF